jgi:pimeloyl-ACP methyl ester carboxylesterase
MTTDSARRSPPMPISPSTRPSRSSAPTRPAGRRSSSSTGSGCCRAAGTAGRRCSRRPGGFAALTPGWPDDPETVEEANAHPEVFAHKSVGQVADHFEAVMRRLEKKPAVIGHSFGGLLAQIVAGRGLAAASVAIDPAPFRGVLPLPISSLKSAAPVLGNPANRNRGPAHLRPVPVRLRQRRHRGRGQGALRELRGARARQAGSSRPRRRTSTRGPRRRSTPRTPSAGRSSSSRARRTTRSRGRSRTRPTSSRGTTRA